MNPWVVGIIGFSLGWLLELLIDIKWWQRRRMIDPANKDGRPSIHDTDKKINELESKIRSFKGRVSVIPGLEDSLKKKTKMYDLLLLEVEQLRSGQVATGDEIENPEASKQDNKAPRHQESTSRESTMNAQTESQSTSSVGKSEYSSSDAIEENDSTARNEADNLLLIRGIGPKTVELLNQFGIYTFQQIADFTPNDIDHFNKKMRFKGRIEKETWVEQAQSHLLEN